MKPQSLPEWWPLVAHHGVRLSGQLLAAGFDMALLSPHANRVLTVAVADNRFWTIRVTDQFSPFRLEADEKVFLPNLQRKTTGPITGLKIVSEHGTQNVYVPSTLGYRRLRSMSGVPLGDIGAVHGRWWVCAPFAQLSAGTVADFASMHAAPPPTPWRPTQWSVSDCQHAADTARSVTAARCWHLDGTKVTQHSEQQNDGSRLLPYVSALASLEPHCLSISLGIHTQQRTILQLYAAGADAINFPLRRLETGHIAQADFSQSDMHHVLRYAVKVMSYGSVSMTMWADSASPDQFAVIFERLGKLGVIPVLVSAGSQSLSQATWQQLSDLRATMMKQHGLDKTLARNFPRTVCEGQQGPGYWHRIRTSWRRLIRLQRHYDSTRPG